MISEARAREIAREMVNPADADWNRIALFGATGTVEKGVGDAARDAAAYATAELGGIAIAEANDLAEYLISADPS
jgi:hypothetical protein